MAGASGIRAGRAYVELGVNDGMTKGLLKAQTQLKSFGDGLKSIGVGVFAAGAGVVGALSGAAALFASMGSEVLDMSRRTGVGVEAIQELGYAAAQDGVEIATLEGGLRKMQKTVVEAARGSTQAQEALGLLGLSVKDLDGMKPEKMFALIGDRVSKVQDPTIKAALAMEVFGKSGASLLPMLKNGASGLTQMADEARRYNLVMSEADTKSAHALGDSMTLLGKAGKALLAQVGSALAPMLTDLAMSLSTVVAAAIDWVRNNKDLIVTVFKVAAVVAAAGAALVTVGTVIVGVGAVIGSLASIFGVLMGAIAPVVAVVGALLSPMGLLVGAAVAAGGALLYFSGTAGKVATYAVEQFQGLKEDATGAFEGIRDALMAGDIEMAAMILWEGLKTIWARFTTEISKLWTTWVYDLVEAFEVIKSTVEGVFDSVTTKAADWLTQTAHTLGADELVLGVKLDDSEAQQVSGALQKKLDANNAEREKGLQDQIAALEAAKEGELTAADEALAKQREKLKLMIAQAKEARQAKDGASRLYGDGSDGPPKPLELADLAPAVAAASKLTLSASGTFNASATQSLQAADSPLKQVEKNTAETAKATKGLLARAREGGAEFE